MTAPLWSWLLVTAFAFSLGACYGGVRMVRVGREAVARERRRATIGQAYVEHDGRRVVYTPAGFTQRFTYRGRDVDGITLQALTKGGFRVVNEDAKLDDKRSQDWWLLDELGLGDFTGCRANAVPPGPLRSVDDDRRPF